MTRELAAKDSTRIDYAARIQDAVDWLEQHQAEDVTPAQLAAVAHFSPFHFHRIFRGVRGESVMQCLRRLRLERAALRLRRTDDAVIDVALDAGFGSHEGFTRAFKEQFGEPPAIWRKQVSPRLAATLAGLGGRIPVPEVELRTTRAQRFVCTRHQGSFDDVNAAWEAFVGLAARHGLLAGATMFGRYPDDPDVTPPGKIRFDVGVVGGAAATAELPDGLRADELPGGTWAIAVHRGSYATLSETYLALVGGWFPHTGHALADLPCLEKYLNTPADAAEADLVTEVWAPISRAG